AGNDAANQYAQANPVAIGVTGATSIAAGAPQVDAYDELVYRCKPGDSFQGISTAYYQSDKMAQALLLFNRSHPRVGDGIRQEPPGTRRRVTSSTACTATASCFVTSPAAP